MRISTESLQDIVKMCRRDGKKIAIRSDHLCAMAEEILQSRGYAPVHVEEDEKKRRSWEFMTNFEKIIRGGRP